MMDKRVEAEVAIQQPKIVLPGQVWQHYKGQEVLVERIEYSRNAIGEGAIVGMRGKDVHAAGDIQEDAVIVVYSHEGNLWARSLVDFLEVLGGNVNRFELVHDPRAKRRLQQSGFTLVELLFVIGIITILAAISVPSFIGATARARQSVALANIGSLNKAQQVYYAENAVFAATLDDLASGIPSANPDYQFASVGTNSGVTSRAVSQAILPNGSSLRGYVGVVQLSANADGNVQSLSIICASQPGVAAVAPAVGTDFNTATACGAGQEKL